MGNTILITGATGFLGSNLTKQLIARGQKVIALKRASSSLRRIASISQALTLYDIEGLDFSALFNEHPDISTIIHTATCYGKNGEDIIEVFDSNTGFPLRLMNAAHRAGVKAFINTDTILDKYLNLYSMSKNQLLEWGKFFAFHKMIRFSNIRLEHIYGPDDDTHKFTSKIIEGCLHNEPTLQLTPGDQKRDFIYIDDVISAYLILIENVHRSEDMYTEFDIGSGQSVSIKDFVNTVHTITASRTQLNFGALPYREGEIMFSEANIQPLRNLGWSCITSLVDGLTMTIESYKQ